MKKILNITLLATVGTLLFLSACSDNIESNRNEVIGDKPISFISHNYNAGLANSQRIGIIPDQNSFLIHWKVDDDIGIFATAYDDMENENNFGVNKRYNAIPKTDETKCDFSPNSSSDIYNWQFGKSHKFFAYYPYSELQTNQGIVSVAIPSSQIQEENDKMKHIAQNLLLIATPVGKAKNDFSAVNLIFSNLYSIIEFRVKMENGEADNIISSLNIKTTDNFISVAEGTVNLETTKMNISKGTKNISLSFTENPTINQTEQLFYVVVAPGAHSASSVSIEMVNDGFGQLSIPIAEGVTFKPGICHTRSLEFKNSDFIMPESVYHVEISKDILATSSYVSKDLSAGTLYTDRLYIVKNIPSKFAGWKMATTGIRTRLSGTIKASAAGKVYIITRINRQAMMETAGWLAETPLSGNDVVYEDTSPITPLIIWSKEVTKGQSEIIPGFISDQSFGGFIPIAPSMTIVN